MQSPKGKADMKLDKDIAIERLKQLDKIERLLMGLYFYESLTVEEIALVMQKDSAAVQSMLDQMLYKILNDPSDSNKTKTYSSELLGNVFN